MGDEVTWGGFIPANIRKWLLIECLKSGDPENFFRALQDQVDDIDQIWEEYGGSFWDELQERWDGGGVLIGIRPRGWDKG